MTEITAEQIEEVKYLPANHNLIKEILAVLIRYKDDNSKFTDELIQHFQLLDKILTFIENMRDKTDDKTDDKEA